MMKKFQPTCFAVFILLIFSCSSTRTARVAGDDGKIEINLLQVNDVYEIAPLAGGTFGGMARVATLKKQLRQQNPNTFLIMAGDFLSPSVFNSIRYQGKRVRGKQMVEAMNAAGMDFVTFGNHEFDITENELQERINESGFTWIASNTLHKIKDSVLPFSRTGAVNAPFPETFILNVSDADGTKARVGFIGLTLPFNKASYVTYTDPLTKAVLLYNQLKDSVDAVVAITHQLMEDDIRLAEALPGLAAILGGHEHDMRNVKVGNVYITKAHANAKSAFVVRLQVNKNTRTNNVFVRLQQLDTTVALDPNTNVVVDKWMTVAANYYDSMGFATNKVVLQSGSPLDGRESEIRKQPTNLTRLIVKAMEAAAPKAELVILNSGSIRVDDILPMPLTQYDILRSLPYGGGMIEVDMKGSLLKKILETGEGNKGLGGYLQISERVSYKKDPGSWYIGNNKIESDNVYRVALADFLLTGGETKLEFLTPKNPGITKVFEQSAGLPGLADIRLAIIHFLEKEKE